MDKETGSSPQLSEVKFRCCNFAKTQSTASSSCTSDRPSQSVSLLERVTICLKESSLPQIASGAAAGTGIYFNQSSLDRNYGWCHDNTELEKLFHLATVACEAQESSSRCRQLVKKHRTPRHFYSIDGSRFTNVNGRGFPAPKRQRIDNLKTTCCPPWVDVTQSSRCANPNGHCSSKNVVVKFTHVHQTEGNVACQPTNAVRLPKGFGHRLIPSAYPSKLPNDLSRPGRLPGQETRVQRFSKRILQFVGEATIAEKFIRGALGNNPDTSKALRLLLTEQKLKRHGDGGRGNAFLYVATPAGLRELAELEDIVSKKISPGQ